MKKFLNIRNILILLIIIIAVVYICWGRSSDIKSSKTYQLFNRFMNYGAAYHNDDNTMLKLEHSDENIDISVIYTTDSQNKREVRTFNINNKKEKLHSQTVTITNKEGSKSYNINHTEKTYFIFDTLKDEGTEFYANWSRSIIDLITKDKYYTKGYENINEEKMHYEYFKEANSKFYYNSQDELMYVKTEDLDKSFKNSNNPININDLNLYKVTITHDNMDESLIKIPEGYEVMKIEEDLDE